MGAAVSSLIGFALLALTACSGGDARGLGSLPGDGGHPHDAGGADPDAGYVSAGSNVGGRCATDSDCLGSQPHCRSRIDPGATVEGLLLLTMDTFGTDEDAGVLSVADLDLDVDTPGGYCSGPCVNDGDCGPGGVCFGLAPWIELFGVLPDGAMPGGFLSDSGQCLQPCDRDDDCRTEDGHVCRDALAGAPPLVEIPGVFEVPPELIPRYCLPPLPVSS
jgi:hypothetical protein